MCYGCRFTLRSAHFLVGAASAIISPSFLGPVEGAIREQVSFADCLPSESILTYYMAQGQHTQTPFPPPRRYQVGVSAVLHAYREVGLPPLRDLCQDWECTRCHGAARPLQ